MGAMSSGCAKLCELGLEAAATKKPPGLARLPCATIAFAVALPTNYETAHSEKPIEKLGISVQA